MPTPKVARNLGTLTFHRYRENRRISTIRFQTLKYTQGNYVRHFWGTTPARRLSGTTTPHATTSTSSVRQHTSMAGTAPVTRHYTRYEALHPLRGATPITRHHTPYEAPHPLRGTTPVTGHYTRYGALHPLRGATPVTRHHTRYGAVHPLRGSAPDQKGCNAYGSGAAPPITRTNAESARRGPGCRARGRWRGLAGQRTNNEPDRLEAAAGPAGPGRASSRRAERSSRRGRRAGEQATRRPEICRGNEQREAARLHRDRAAHTSGDSCQKPQLSRRSRWRRRGRLRR